MGRVAPGSVETTRKEVSPLVWRTAAVVRIDAEGRYLAADPQALELLGVDSEERLRTLPPEAFQATPPDPEAEAAFKAAMLDGPFHGLLGEGPIQRLDGELVRVRTAIIPQREGGYRVLLYPLERPTADLTPRIFKIDDVLAEWRTAERRLVQVDRATAEGAQIALEVERLKEQYHVLFERASEST